MATILKGAPVVAAMNERNAALCEQLKAKGITPTLAVVRVGEREDDLSYERGVIARCGKVGVEDEAGFAEHLAGLERLCEICKLLDCRYIRMFSFFIPHGKDPDSYRDVVIEKLRKFAAVAEKHDVILLHENEKDIYGDTGARCRVIFEALASPHFRAAFDFANFVQCGEDTEKCWELLRPYIEYIHIKDAVSHDKENVLCGTGEGKIKALLTRAIRDEGYEGFLTLEPHLVLFASLQSLETEDAANIIKKNKAKDGAEGYAMQYHALREILDAI